MTGPEHFQAAESCLDTARRSSDKGRDEDAAFWQREAQVHATLALAAATALRGDTDHGLAPSEYAPWAKAAGQPLSAPEPAASEPADDEPEWDSVDSNAYVAAEEAREAREGGQS